MAIQVVCPGCKKRFSVADQHAGKQGPCPACKAIITIPQKTEEVVVHTPEDFGPKDRKGRAVLKPISRKDAKISPLLIAGVILAAIASITVAFILRSQGAVRAEGWGPYLILGLGAALLAPPVVWGGYSVLRDDELEAFRGSELWIRVGACAAAYAALWGIVSFVAFYLFGSDPLEVIQLVFIVPVMVAAGAFAAYASLDLDFGVGALHYGFFLLVTVVLRLITGLPPIGPPSGS